MIIKNAAIIGAGIAGLTAALCLARKGIASVLYEQAPEMAEVGAGLQVSPNASRILEEIGVLATLTQQWLEPPDIRLVSGRSLRTVASVECGDFARRRWGAPYGVVHRATLQKALLAAVEKAPLCTLRLGASIDPERLGELATDDGRPFDLVIGADGVWSKTRKAITGSAAPTFAGSLAWRFSVQQDSAPHFFSRESVMAFLGASAHLVCYPLRETGTFNIVAVTSGASVARQWDGRAASSQLQRLHRDFESWHPALKSLIRSADPALWPLYEVHDGRWDNGRNLVLIGDAAHAMTPFAAQGAAMAIEDAFELAGFVAHRNLPEALALFSQRRKPRIARMRQRAAFNRFAYHARGPLRLGRDFVLGLRPTERLAADLDWIYGYHAIG